MSFQFMHKILTLIFLLSILSACGAPPASAPGQANPTALISSSPDPTHVQPSATPTATPTQAQNSACSPIPLGESLAFVTYKAGNQITPIDPQNGLPTCGYQPLTLRDFSQYAFSPNQKILAISDEDLGASPDVRLHLIDLETWQVAPTSIAVDGWVNSQVFNPSSTQLAMLVHPDSSQAQGDNLEVVDLQSQAVVKRQALGFSPSLAQYTPDGRQLVLFGGDQSAQADTTPAAHLLVLDAQDYSTLWETQFEKIPDGIRTPKETSTDPIPDQWGPAAALSQDGHSLFILHADGASLTTVNLENHQVATQDVSPKLSWLSKLIGLGAQTAYAKGINGTTRQGVLSSKGLFYTLGNTNTSAKDANGNWSFSSTPLGLQVIDVQNGEIVGQLDTQTSQLALSADESRLYLQGWNEEQPWTEVISTDGLQVLRRMENTYLAPAKLLNGQNILMSSQVGVDRKISLGVVDPQALESGNPWPTWTFANSWQLRNDPPWLSPSAHN